VQLVAGQRVNRSSISWPRPASAVVGRGGVVAEAPTAAWSALISVINTRSDCKLGRAPTKTHRSRIRAGRPMYEAVRPLAHNPRSSATIGVVLRLAVHYFVSHIASGSAIGRKPPPWIGSAIGAVAEHQRGLQRHQSAGCQLGVDARAFVRSRSALL